MNAYEEATRCMLCHEAPCSTACPKQHVDPARGLRALHLDSNYCYGMFLNENTCNDCPAPCQEACIHPDFPIRIKEIALGTPANEPLKEKVAKNALPSLAIEFCGVKCENPFFLGSSVIASSYDMLAKALRMGWGGAVYKTISYGEIKEVSPRFDEVDLGRSPFMGFRNMEQLSVNSPEEDFDILRRLKEEFPTKVLVASIMGRTDEEWAQLARMAQEAGCDMVECNFSCPHMAAKGRGSDIGQVPEVTHHLTQLVKQAVSIPVMAKMTPNITHIEEPAIAARQGGADAIAAINTIKSVTLKSRSEVNGLATISGYSGKAVKPISQRFIVELCKEPELAGVPISGIGGIVSWRDALEYLVLGCRNVQVCTAVMQYGYRLIDDLTLGLQDWMDRKGFKSLDEVVGKALPELVGTDMLDRDTIILPHFDQEACIGCGRCYVSCYDGGHQAIRFDAETRRPHLIGKNCVGCHLCLLVCPVSAIKAGKRITLPKKKVTE